MSHMEQLTVANVLGAIALAYVPAYYKLSPASISTKIWTTIWGTILAVYIYYPALLRGIFASISNAFTQTPVKAIFIAFCIAAPLKYVQHKLRFARINALKMKYGFTDDPASFANMTVPQAEEIERNMAEWEFPRLWQFGWISDFFRTSTDPGVSRTINASGHFINVDKRVEHQRMQATVHLMTGLAAYEVKSANHSLVTARINEHHHRYGIKINSDDVLYLVIHFGLAPVPWINKFGYRKLEPFEVNAIWVLWREIGCRMGLKYIPKTLEQALEWRKNFENTFRWREDANEIMAMAMLDQVLYPIPKPLKGFVSQVFASIIDYDIVYYCQLEKLHPSPLIREIVGDLFRTCGWFIRHFSFPRLNAYQRSPPEANADGKMNFGHTPYDTMPYWQEASFWNLWGPRALLSRLRGLPLPSAEFQSEGVPLQAMGAPHPHAATQAKIEKKVLENAAILEEAPYGYRPAIGFQANRLLPPVDGPAYGDHMNTFPDGTPTTPNNPSRFTREYERRGAGFSTLGSIEKPKDVELFDVNEARQNKVPDVPHAFVSTPMVSVSA